MDQVYTYKVIFLGNPGVGKTTLFRRLKYPDYDGESRLTDSLNITPCDLEFTFEQSVRVQLQLHDTCSTERYRSSVPTNYFRRSHGVVLVYDVTDPTSLYDLEDWMTDAYNKTTEGSSLTYSLIGTKSDQQHDTDASDGKHFCEKHGIPQTLHFKTSLSSKDVQPLMDGFKILAHTIHLAQNDTRTGKNNHYISLSHDEKTPLLSKKKKPAKSNVCSKC